MKKKLRFVTIFPKVEDVHLMKEIGLIPWGMSKYYGYSSTLLLLDDQKYPTLKTLPELDYTFTPKIKASKYVKTFVWLILNARNIDVLHLFYQYRHTRMCILMYLLLNRKGLIYVHFDTKATELKDYQIKYNGGNFNIALQKIFIKLFVYSKRNRKRILWGVQNTKALKNIQGHYPYDNVAYMPDGYFEMGNGYFGNFENKENIILTVGRIGAKEKRTDLLLEAFAMFAKDNKDWHLKIVGSIDPTFEKYRQEFMSQHAEIMDQIEFVGPVYDRKALYQQYEKAKIFCLPSDFESFGIAAAEAQSRGCALILTKYPAAFDITDNGKYGELIDFGNKLQLAAAMQDLVNKHNRLSWICNNCAKYAQENFSYKELLKTLNVWIQEELYNEG